MREKMTIDEMRERLLKAHVGTVAKETGMSRQTVYNFTNDVHAKPTSGTIKLLEGWLELNDKRENAKRRIRRKS